MYVCMLLDSEMKQWGATVRVDFFMFKQVCTYILSVLKGMFS